MQIYTSTTAIIQFFFSFENDRLEWMMIMICKEKKTNKEIDKIWYLKKKKSSKINNLIWFFLKKWLDKLYKVECSAKIDNNFCNKKKKNQCECSNNNNNNMKWNQDKNHKIMLFPYEREINLVFMYVRLVVTVHFTVQ